MRAGALGEQFQVVGKNVFQLIRVGGNGMGRTGIFLDKFHGNLPQRRNAQLPLLLLRHADVAQATLDESLQLISAKQGVGLFREILESDLFRRQLDDIQLF